MNVPPPHRLLVVDDQQDVLKTIEIILRNSPFDAVLVDNPEKALDVAEAQHFDIVLLDILMPDMSGIALCVRLRRIPHLADVPVVMLTATNDIGLQRRAMTAGADTFLLKPIGKKALIAHLEETLTKHKNQHGNSAPSKARVG